MEEINHLLSILKKVQEALKNNNYVKIKSLSDNVIQGASIEQNPDFISLAVILYSLSKLIEREQYRIYKNWPKFYHNYLRSINEATGALEKRDIERFRKEIESIRNLIENLTGKLKFYIDDVFRKAKINKASRIYGQGISMEKTAKILGISVWELAEYAGKTNIGDVNWGITMPIQKRIKLAEEIFRK